MFRSLSFALVVCAATLSAGCKAEFKPFSSSEGNFTCEFPGKPKQESKPGPGGVTMHMFSTEERSGAYLAAYADMPIPGNESAEQIEDRLNGARDGMIGNINAKLDGESKIKLDGKYLGREIKATLPEGKGAVRARVYLVDKRLYQIMVIGKPGYSDSADATRFLDSLKLTK